MNQEEAPAPARVSAAQALLDRGWGKPTQPIAGDDEADPIKVIQEIRRIIVDPPNSNSKGIPSAS